MTACNFYNKAGQPSELFNQLEGRYGAVVGSRVMDFVNSKVFEDYYPDVERETDGEVKFSEVVLLQIPDLINERPQSAATVNEVKSYYQDFLPNVTVQHVNDDVDFQVDTIKIPAIGIGVDELRLEVKVNLDRLNKRLSLNKRGVTLLSLFPANLKEAGVKLAKKEPIHDILSKVLTQHTEQDFDDELLMAAMSDENIRATEEWKLYHNKIVKYLSDTFGKTPADVEAMLNDAFYNMPISTLTSKMSNARKLRFRDNAILRNTVKPLAALTAKLSDQITKKIKIYFSNMSELDKTNSSSYAHLESLRLLFEQYKTGENVNAILGYISEMAHQMHWIEQRIDRLESDLLNGDKITDEALYRIAQYSSVFDSIEDIQVMLGKDAAFNQELAELFTKAGDKSKFKTVKSFIDDLAGRYRVVQSTTRNITNIYLANKLVETGKGRVRAAYEEEARKEFDVINRERKKEANKKDSTKRQYEADKKAFVAERFQSNRRDIVQQEANRIYDLLNKAPNDISFLERMGLDRNALGDDLVQIVSEHIDRAEFEVDTATTEVVKDLEKTTKKFETEVRNGLNQEKKYDEFITPEVTFDFDTNTITIGTKKAGFLTSAYYPQVFTIQKQLADEYYAALKDGSDPDTLDDLRNKMIMFRRENFDSPMNESYYAVIDSLNDSPEAQRVFNAYRDERSAMLRPYIAAAKKAGTKFDTSTLPLAVHTALSNLEAKYSKLFNITDDNGDRKTGVELEIAMRVTGYKAAFGSMYEQTFREIEFEDAREAAKLQGKEDEFLSSNTTEKTGKAFFKTFGKLNYSDVFVQDARERYKQSTASWKAYQKRSDWNRRDSDEMLDQVRKDFTDYLNAIKISPNPDIQKFMQDAVEFRPRKGLVANANNSVPDVLGMNNGNPILLPVYTSIQTTDSLYLKLKPKSRWYNSKLKEEYLKTGRNEFEVARPTKRWENPNFAKIQADPKLRDTYNEYLHSLKIADDLLLERDRLIADKGDGVIIIALPTVAKSHVLEVVGEQGLFNYIKTKAKRFWRNESTEPGFGTDIIDETKTPTEIMGGSTVLAIKNVDRQIKVLTDEKGEQHRRVPVNFRFKAESSEQSFDLPTIIALNYQMSKNFAEKSKILFTVELVKNAMAERDVVKTSMEGLTGVKSYIDALTGKTTQQEVTSKGIDSNSFKAMQSAIDDRVYGITSMSGYKMTQVANAISKYTADVLLIANYMSAGTNLMTGNIYNFIEASAGRHFDGKALRQAQSKYFFDSLQILGDIGKRVYSSKTNLLNEKFTVLSDWTATKEKFIESTRALQLFKGNTAHALSTIAEHNLQSTAAYAMLTFIKIKNKDGEYITTEGKVTKDVNEAMSMDEAYTVIDGKLQLHPEAFSVVSNAIPADLNFKDNQREIEFAVSRMIKDVNADMQGQYNPKMKAELQRHWWGQLIMLLRKFAPRGVHRRFRGIGSSLAPFEALIETDKFYSRAQGVYNEGYYTTTIRLGAELFRDAKALKWQLLSFEGIRKLKQVRGLKLEAMEDWQRSNLRKSTRDFLTTATLYTIAMIAVSLKNAQDEEDETMKAILTATAFYSLRGFKELSTFVNPNEMLSTLRTPSIALTMVNRMTIFLSQLVEDSGHLVTGEGFERYQTGRRKGDTKLYKTIEDIVPGLKNINRDMDEALSWFLNRRAY